MIVLGVDPGMSGAVARYNTRDGSLDVRRSFKKLDSIARAVKDLSEGADFAVVELVSARPGQGVTSMFTFGRSTGTAMGALSVLGIPFVEVAPSRWSSFWSKRFNVEHGAFYSPDVASKVFPEHIAFFRRKLDHNTADACLIAAYGAEIALSEGVITTSREKDRDVVGVTAVPVIATPVVPVKQPPA